MRKLCIPDISFSALGEKGEVQRVSAAQQLLQLASVPSEPGKTFTIDEIRQRLPLVDKLAAAVADDDKEMLLEDSEYAILLEAIKTSTWTGVSRAALSLVEAVEAAESVEVEEQG